MARLNLEDNFKFLTTAAARIEIMTAQLDQYLSQYFQKAKTYYSRKSIFGQVINYIKDLSNLIMYYVHKSTTENNIITAQNDVSLAHFAELSGHNIVRYISSKGSVRFHLLPNTASEIGNTLIVRKYAELKCEANSLTYLVDIADEHKIISLSKNDFVLPVIEGKIKEFSFVSDGTPIQTIHLEETENIEMYEVKVFVNEESWEQVAGLTEMTYQSKSWFVKTGFINALDIIFGDGVRGAIPPRGANIRIQYIISNGEYGNLPEGNEITFKPLSGFYDGNSAEVELAEYATITKEAGFILGSYGDSKEVLRNIIGFNDRTLVLAADKNYEALISQFSTLSRVHVWSSPDNLVIKNLLVLPNLNNRLNNSKDYLYLDEKALFLTQEQKDALVSYIETSNKSYAALEIRFVEPTVRKYAINVYLDAGTEIQQTLRDKVEDTCISVFVKYTFDKLKLNTNLNIVKADIIKALREALPGADSIAANIISEANEEAKINGFYYERENLVLKSTTKKVIVDPNIDPCIGLSENNDVISDWLDIVPLLRGNFKIFDKNVTDNNYPVLQDAVNVYVKSTSSITGWIRLEK